MRTTTVDQTHFHALVFDDVRRIRAEALNLLETTDEIITILNDTNLSAHDAQTRLQHSLTIGSRIIAEHGPQVHEYFETINSLLAQHPELNIQGGEDVSTDITIMSDAWDKALWNWGLATQANQPSTQDLLFQMDEVKQSILTLGVKAQILTFPDLVNQKLLDMRTGEALNFFQEFSDEFTQPEFLPIAWKYLREHPHRINGFMTENGIIYRASPTIPHFVSFICIIGVVALGFLLIWLAGILHYFPLPSMEILFPGYIAVMAGGLVHTFVDIWKLYQTKPNQARNILGNWILWIHVKQITVLSGILTLWAGFIILVALQQINMPEVAFLAGYSIDSFVGLFLIRFTDTAQQNIATLGSQNLPKSTRQQVADVVAKTPRPASPQHS